MKLYTFLLVLFISFFFSGCDKQNNLTVNKSMFAYELNGVDIEYPNITYHDNEKMEVKINKLIQKIYYGYDIDIKNKRVLQKDLEDFTSSYELTYNKNDILSLKFSSYFYFNGAAHGNTDVDGLNINLKDGKVLAFEDVLDMKYKDQIVALVKDELLNHKCKDMFFEFLKIDVYKDQVFYIKDDNLVVVYPKYDITPGVCGVVEVELDFEDIKDYIKYSSIF
jgi:hypothetical protein